MADSALEFLDQKPHSYVMPSSLTTCVHTYSSHPLTIAYTFRIVFFWTPNANFASVFQINSKMYKRNHDRDNNEITLWLITKVGSARTQGGSCKWDRCVHLCWSKSLLLLNFIFIKVYSMWQFPGNFVMDKRNNRTSFKWSR